MSTPQIFEDLVAWQSARELTNVVYELCRRERLARDYGLCDQLRRASVSVMNNIAEGWESHHTAEKIQFYNIARRSCGEVRSMSYILLDNQFLSTTEHSDFLQRCQRSGQLISGLMRSLNQR